VTYTPFLLNWDGTRRRAKSLTEVGLGAGFSIRGVTAEDSDFEIKRFNARASYLALRGRLRHTVFLPRDLQLGARLDGQYSGVPLIVNEQYAVGGVESVRGYLEFAAVGDSGYAASLEMRSPSFAKTLPGTFTDARVHAFVDGGQTTILDALPGQDAHFSLLSTGVGMRLRESHGLVAAVDVAYPFETAGLSEKGKTRVHFKASYQF
jgi:hemolysin activation/secretion protein